MSYTLLNLITDAYCISKIRSPDFQTVTGADISIGISQLNAVLSGMSADSRNIPYYKEYVLNAVIGQELYFIPYLVEMTSLTFNLQVVRFATTTLDRREYHGRTRIDGIISLPFENTVERCLGGSNLYLQYLPADTYVIKIWGKFGLTEVTEADLSKDILLVYDRWYADFLMHLLIKRICNYFGTQVSPDVQNNIDKIASNVSDMNPMNLTPMKVNYYCDRGQPNWVILQLSRGFTP